MIMPSGLTCKIYDGSDMTLRGFALTCVTQLGAGYNVTEQGTKDLPKDKPPVMKPSSFHKYQLEEAKEELTRLTELKSDPEKLKQCYDAELTKRELENISYKQHKALVRQRYNSMLTRVSAWNVSEEYTSLKELMLKQLRESIEHDCREDLQPPYSELPSIDEWIDGKIDVVRKSIDYHNGMMVEDEEYCKSVNEYMKGLYDAIDEIEPLKGEE